MNHQTKTFESQIQVEPEVVLTDLELLEVLGGGWSGDQGADAGPPPGQSADFSNSGDYRNGAMQMAGAVGGIVAAGIGLMTAPISLPLALVGAVAAAAVGGFAAADAQMDMQNAQPDPDNT